MTQQTSIKNTKTMVQQCLCNKDITQARELWIKETIDKGINSQLARSEFLELFKKYPPDNGVCPICKGKTVKQVFNDYRFVWESKSFCEPCKLEAYKDNLNKNIDETMKKIAPKRYWNAKITDFDPRYKDMHKTDGLFLYGDKGAGKTHLMVAMTREIILDTPPFLRTDEFDSEKYINLGKNPVFISTSELLMRIRNCFSDNSGITEAQLLDKYSNVDVLMLDDLGAEKPTEWVMNTLYLIIDKRYGDMKKTIISSNYSLNQIAKNLGDRISSRIAGMCQGIKMTGKDRRL